jgi:isopenicillin-N epimerase
VSGPEAAAGGDPRFAPLWTLRPDVDYLNHGSFGACPRRVLERQAALRAELEAEPADFLIRALPERLAAARAALGGFVGASPDDLAFVPNATTGVNAVVRSFALGAGDEILTTDHTYGACRRTLDYAAAATGARVVPVAVPFPLGGPEEIMEPVLAAVTPRTRLALLDHVTSPTALVLPVERLVAALRERGVETLIDGAHALGMLPLDLGRIGAAYYTANAHKWLCAPKGAAFLHVRADRQAGVHPTVISWGYDPARPQGAFRAEFDWGGTVDPTAWLCIPECLDHLGGLLEGGWAALMERNRQLTLRARDILCAALGVPPPCPDAMIGSLASVPLPAPAAGAPAGGEGHEDLIARFRARGIETWFFPWPGPGGMVVRAAAQVYNREAQFHRLAAALREAWLGG